MDVPLHKYWGKCPPSYRDRRPFWDIQFSESGFGYLVGMRLSCYFVNVYKKLICTKSPKCHVVLLADVVVSLFLAMNFVTATIFVYTVV